jgi:cell division septation protein DedD
MAIDIFEYISHLLHRNQVVIVPGLGAFTSTLSPAMIDHARGILHPPSKVVSFNDNLKVNDGMLLNYIKNRHGISADDSRILIENFVSSVKGLLNSGESVIFENLGKIYTNPQGKLIFENNFRANHNPATFGLPTVSYHPISRNNRINKVEEKPSESVQNTEKKVEIAENVNVSTPNEVVPSSSSEKVKMLPSRKTSLLAAGLLAGTLLTGYMLYNGKNKSEIDSQAINVSERTNVKPTKEVENTDNTALTSPDEIVKVESKKEEKPNISSGKIEKSEKIAEKTAPKEENKEETSLNNESQSQVVFIGSFSSEKNASKLAKRLKRKGFSVYREKFNGLRRVGTRVKFSSESEKLNAITKLKRIFGAQCWEK